MLSALHARFGVGRGAWPSCDDQRFEADQRAKLPTLSEILPQALLQRGLIGPERTISDTKRLSLLDDVGGIIRRRVHAIASSQKGQQFVADIRLAFPMHSALRRELERVERASVLCCK